MYAWQFMQAREAQQDMKKAAMKRTQTMQTMQAKQQELRETTLYQESLFESPLPWQHLPAVEQFRHHEFDGHPHLGHETPFLDAKASTPMAPVVVPPPRKFMAAAHQPSQLPTAATETPAALPSARQPQLQKGGKMTSFVSKVIFPGFDAELHHDFDLVPRLIGRGGTNMRKIANACGGTVRLRGPGTGAEQPRAKDGMASEVPLHILLTCPDQASDEVGKQELVNLLDNIFVHFQRYLNKKSMRQHNVFYAFSDKI